MSILVPLVSKVLLVYKISFYLAVILSMIYRSDLNEVLNTHENLYAGCISNFDFFRERLVGFHFYFDGSVVLDEKIGTIRLIKTGYGT